MEAIKRIISREQFKLYNIPDSFGEEAEMIIIPVNKNEDENKISSYNGSNQVPLKDHDFIFLSTS